MTSSECNLILAQSKKENGMDFGGGSERLYQSIVVVGWMKYETQDARYCERNHP